MEESKTSTQRFVRSASFDFNAIYEDFKKAVIFDHNLALRWSFNDLDLFEKTLFYNANNEYLRAGSAFLKLKVITFVLNEGWAPDWSNVDEIKYTPSFRVFETGELVCDGHEIATNSLPGRIYLRTPELAEHIGKEFSHLFRDMSLLPSPGDDVAKPVVNAKNTPFPELLRLIGTKREEEELAKILEREQELRKASERKELLEKASPDTGPAKQATGDLKKPPLGLMPRKIFLRDRMLQIVGAIERYRESDLNIPWEWLDELCEISRDLLKIN